MSLTEKSRCSRFWPVVVPLLLVYLAGCALLAPPAQTPPVNKQRTAQPLQRLTAPGPVIVLQTDGSPAYTRVVTEILQQWKGNVEVIRVAKQKGDTKAQQQAQNSPIAEVIAIGLPAARVARSLTGKKVVFCQVFNYEEEDLIRPWMKGVSALPPVRQQFKAWKELNPGLRNIAVIVGDGLRGLTSEAQAAALALGIKLQHMTVNSDLSLRTAAKTLGPEVQGLWLVPDNRVLSHEALREVLAQSRARGRQVLVMSEQLLSLGATLSAESDLTDVAHQVLSRIRMAAGRPNIPGPDVLPLTKTNIKINKAWRGARSGNHAKT